MVTACSPRLTSFTEVVVREVLGVNLHALYMLPHTALITRYHVAIVMLQLTYTPRYIVTIVLLICVCVGGVKGQHICTVRTYWTQKQLT